MVHLPFLRPPIAADMIHGKYIIYVNFDDKFIYYF